MSRRLDEPGATRHRNPAPTVDIIIEHEGGIVLIERRNPPHGWALPGGFIDYGESAEDAAVREAREETGLALENLRQFHVYSDPKRDPRFHTITTVFVARGSGRLRAADDAARARVFDPKALPETVAFDHRRIVRDYVSDRWDRA
jgi:8-oxo-dGTP diphosphatase